MRKPLSSPTAAKAFTLMELLIVVAIIGVLVAFLYAGFSATRRQARNTLNIQNLKQIGVALHQYIAENRGYILPRVYHATAIRPQGDKLYWPGTLYLRGYLKDKRALYDPRFTPFGPQPTDEANRRDIETGTPATYGMRDWVKPGETITSFTARVAKPVNIIERPSDFFIVADSYWMAWNTQGYGISPGAGGDNRVRVDSTGHAHALFMDGHVEAKPASYFEALHVTQGEYSDNKPIPVWRP